MHRQMSLSTRISLLCYWIVDDAGVSCIVCPRRCHNIEEERGSLTYESLAEGPLTYILQEATDACSMEGFLFSTLDKFSLITQLRQKYHISQLLKPSSFN
ncbi:uncharacterized protein BO95DRAFT_260837 [Aspergillus brunneoviolaceus CBS 621.78]|uniref:Uncharacterized protein n=1 Tax=Aspergillus brunneoviolaceus CBS 621.78 TaxID=1450534 RepID=A0ACD1FXD1_9EURO|nr:hypothetical protein BO95DRAFT_260837 [Aspergillus brunneoviolaceus CBS 621.78]RAH41612.1 hypothetical protein BO95DRAFT_260837 [Aspergillus brunneoviolaceus CBS 621.78]